MDQEIIQGIIGLIGVALGGGIFLAGYWLGSGR